MKESRPALAVVVDDMPAIGTDSETYLENFFPQESVRTIEG